MKMNKIRTAIFLGCLSLMSSSSIAQYELSWKASINGVNHEDCRGMVESNDHIYVVGRLEGTTTLNDSTTFQTASTNGGSDIFLYKLTKDGQFVWVKSMGGTLNEQGVNITADVNGNIYICGFYESDFDIDPGTGTTQLICSGERDAFIAKFDPNGNLLWGNSFSGTLSEQPEGIEITPSGILISGRFEGTVDFDPGVGNLSLTSNGSNDIFAVKLDLNGDFLWANSYGDNANDISWEISADVNDNVFVIGTFKNTIDFNNGNPNGSYVSNGLADLFILKLDNLGNYLWSTAIGGPGDDNAKDLAFDLNNDLYISGFFKDTVNFDPTGTPTDILSSGGKDAYLMKLNTNGTLNWIETFGGTGDEIGKGIAFDLENNVYQVGTFQSSLTVSGNTYTSNGLRDCIIRQLDEQGTTIYSNVYGGAGEDYINGLIVDADTSFYFDGKFNDAMNIDPIGTTMLPTEGDYDGYIFKWSHPTPSTVGMIDEQSKYIVAYPNPCDNMLNIVNIERYTAIEIIDLQGRSHGIFPVDENDSQITLETSHLSSGTYFIRLEGLNSIQHTITIQVK
ncbi:MAG: hypothetical protein COA38_16885 [Fluviicola sp.]|nr:MAG: hypothetical protein COA38_16885 [Fluviicola sp.]